MTNNNKLIKDVAIDIIGIVSIWGLANTYTNFSAYININNYKLYLCSPEYPTYIAIGTSVFVMLKYLNDDK